MRDLAAEKSAARHRLMVMLNTLYPAAGVERLPFRTVLLTTTTHANGVLF